MTTNILNGGVPLEERELLRWTHLRFHQIQQKVKFRSQFKFKSITWTQVQEETPSTSLSTRSLLFNQRL